MIVVDIGRFFREVYVLCKKGPAEGNGYLSRPGKHRAARKYLKGPFNICRDNRDSHLDGEYADTFFELKEISIKGAASFREDNQRALVSYDIGRHLEGLVKIGRGVYRDHVADLCEPALNSAGEKIAQAQGIRILKV